MQQITRYTSRALISLVGMLGANMAFAGSGIGAITYAPLQVAAVPTLSGWALAVMGILFAIIAFRVMRAKNVSGRVASIISAGIMAVGGMSGGYLIDESQAVAPAPIPLTVGVGGQVNIQGIGTREYQNTSGVSQRITEINIIGGYETKPIALPDIECTVGLVLANGASCFISIVSSTPPA